MFRTVVDLFIGSVIVVCIYTIMHTVCKHQPYIIVVDPSYLVAFPYAQLQSSDHPKQHNPAVSSADTKFLLIPLAFLLLRCGSIVVVIVFIYAQAKTSNAVAYFLLCVAVSAVDSDTIFNAY